MTIEEPGALKGAHPVRKGAVGKGPLASVSGTSLAPYLTDGLLGLPDAAGVAPLVAHRPDPAGACGVHGLQEQPAGRRPEAGGEEAPIVAGGGGGIRGCAGRRDRRRGVPGRRRVGSAGDRTGDGCGGRREHRHRADARQRPPRRVPGAAQTLFSWAEFMAEGPIKPRGRSCKPQPASLSIFEWALGMERERGGTGRNGTLTSQGMERTAATYDGLSIPARGWEEHSLSLRYPVVERRCRAPRTRWTPPYEQGVLFYPSLLFASAHCGAPAGRRLLLWSSSLSASTSCSSVPQVSAELPRPGPSLSRHPLWVHPCASSTLLRVSPILNVVSLDREDWLSR